VHNGLLDTSVVVLRLRSGRASAQVAPWIGGAIAAYSWEVDGRQLDWLRPTSDDALIEGSPENVSCFPLVPFSNRVRGGRFCFDGRTISLPVDARDPHFEHGHGWRMPWKIEEVSPRSIVLSYSHEADAWPWSYRAEQRFTLTEAALTVEVTLANRATRPMPCGIGMHPYFPRTATTRLTASVAAMWQTDRDVLPTRLAPCREAADPTAGLAVDAAALDNVFTGWDGVAEITWPERAARLRMEAEAPLRSLVVYSPAEGDFFCAEPVSNITDAFNMPAGRHDSGLIVLGAGESARANVRFIPQVDSIS